MQTTARLSQRLRSVTAPPGQRHEEALYDVRLAVGIVERAEAAKLVEQLYGHEGYLAVRSTSAPAPAMPLFSLHHLLDEALVFTARLEGRLVGTLTVIFDSPAGLPMDALYKEELDAHRAAGRRPCEFCSLAVAPDLARNAHGALLELFRAAYRYATYAAGATDVCVTLKPSHAPFYRRICFQPLGGLRLDARFAQAETIALRLPHETARELWASGEARQPCRRLHAFFSRPLTRGEAKALRRRVRAAKRGAAEILGCLLEQPHLADNASEAQRAYLRCTLAERAGGTDVQPGPVAPPLTFYSAALSDRT